MLPYFVSTQLLSTSEIKNGDFTNQNAMQFGITETEKGPWRERRHERGKNKSYECERDSSAAWRQSDENPSNFVFSW